METADRELAGKWLRLAEEDLGAAEMLSAVDPRLTRHALFYCQQAAEKALKGILVAHGTTPPRTHDLTAIWLVAGRLAGWSESPADLGKLSEYAVLTRYPTEERVYEEGELREALEAARAIVAAVAEVL